jgi:ABC-type polysaccharide/polyol phosphate export permease
MMTTYKKIIPLSYSLAKANFKVRNETSYLGVLWYLLNPLCFFLILLYLRGVLFSSASVPHYSVYLMIGLIMLNFFNQAINSSIGLIRGNSGFIKSMKVPYEVFVFSIVFQAAFSHIFEFSLVALLFLYFHISALGLLLYAAVFVFYALFTLGLCFLFSTIGLYFSDFANVWSIISQLLMFVTPVFYVVVPGSYAYSSSLFNPLFYFMTAAREASNYGTIPSLLMFAALAILAAGSLFVGLFFFKRFKSRFAEFV